MACDVREIMGVSNAFAMNTVPTQTAQRVGWTIAVPPANPNHPAHVSPKEVTLASKAHKCAKPTVVGMNVQGTNRAQVTNDAKTTSAY
jgi:hypothetical protein